MTKIGGDSAQSVVRFDGDGRFLVRTHETSEYTQRSAWLDDRALAHGAGREVGGIVADLLDVALAVYVADRTVRRRPSGQIATDLGWHRRFLLEIPVRCSEVWDDRKVEQALRETLEYLTEDSWEFHFVERRRPPRSAEVQRYVAPKPVGGVSHAALFSGGLDSLCGLALQPTSGDGGSIAPVAVVSNPRLRAVVDWLVRSVRRERGAEVAAPFVVPVEVSASEAGYDFDEKSQRSRGFLFAIAGAVAATLVGASELHLYENGTGAINLPISPAQLGAQSARSTHPLALARLERFLGLVLDRPFRIRLPFLERTKAELCRELAQSRLRDFAPVSVSCDGFPLRERGVTHCGWCSSCVLRRQSLRVVGLEARNATASGYKHDVLDEPQAVSARRLAPLCDMASQVLRIRRALSKAHPWSALCIAFPELRELPDIWPSAPSSESSTDRIVDLYRRYCLEWDELAREADLGWLAA